MLPPLPLVCNYLVVLASYFVFHYCALTITVTKKFDEVQILRTLVMMCHFLTRGVIYQSDLKEMTETTAHSNGSI